VSLSACLIVKDEEFKTYPAECRAFIPEEYIVSERDGEITVENLRHCLESLQPIAAQIVVVDTGSSDNTVQVAEDFDCTLGYYEWDKDFASARNVSLELATEDWCLWIDADERIPPENVEAWQQLTADPPDRPTAYNVTLRNYHSEGRISTVNQFRLWSNGYGVRFEGKIHEQIIPQFNALENPDRLGSPLMLDHHGYASDERFQQEKRNRNEEIMLAELEGDPENWYLRFTLSQNMILNGELESAIEQLELVNEHGDFAPQFMAAVKNSLAHCYHQQGNRDRAYALTIESLNCEPMQVIAYHTLSVMYHDKQNYQWAKSAMRQLMEMQSQLMQEQNFRIIHDAIIPEENLQQSMLALNHEINWLQPGSVVIPPNGEMYTIDSLGEWLPVPSIQLQRKS